MRGEICNIQEMAECHGWEEIDHQPNNCMISFLKGLARINVYYSKMTVAICKNKKQVFIKKCTEEKLGDIFNTTKG